MNERIQFICPSCGSQHDRGFLDGVCVFRCLRCGYQGHGFHPDPEVDRDVFSDHQAANKISRELGISETPLGVDPLSHGC